MRPGEVVVFDGSGLSRPNRATPAATVALLKFGLANADAARTSALLSQGIAGSVDGGKALDNARRRGRPAARSTLPLPGGDVAAPLRRRRARMAVA